jgi:hypothetical protein
MHDTKRLPVNPDQKVQLKRHFAVLMASLTEIGDVLETVSPPGHSNRCDFNQTVPSLLRIADCLGLRSDPGAPIPEPQKLSSRRSVRRESGSTSVPLTTKARVSS